MKLQVLGHAALRINAGNRELLCDPWVLGSSYWRSWWNYPPVPESIVGALAPDFVYLTHLHWDHFHGPSLRKFSKGTHFFVPYLRYDRMVRDLRSLGFKNVTEIPHGRRVSLADGLAIRSYQIGPVFADSALIIEAEDQIILNANDAKLAGLPLRRILRDYPRIDFCLRSHSSANARRCMHVTDEPDASLDDESHYITSFSLFMKRVRPRFAIPFASNACFLHREVFEMNAYSQTPSMVKTQFEAFAAREGLDTQLKVMVAGDQWSTGEGFTLAQADWFENRLHRLSEYAQQVGPTLDAYYAREERTRVPIELIQRFLANVWKQTPRWLKRGMSGQKVLIVSFNSSMRDYYQLDLASGAVTTVTGDTAAGYDIRVEFPAIILAQSIRMNMFSQAWISKRVQYYATRSATPVLQKFIRLLEFSEAEAIPIRKGLLTLRAARALLPRWRELLLYAQVLWHLMRRRNFLEIEARLLS